MRTQFLTILALILISSGCVSSSDSTNKLNEITVSGDEIPEGFKLTHESKEDNSNLENSSVISRVHRRFKNNSTNNTAVVLSSATLHKSEENAIKTREDFLNRTGTRFSEPEHVYYDGKKATHIEDIDYATLEKIYYIYRRNGSLNYFIGVKSSQNSETLARLLFKHMIAAETETLNNQQKRPKQLAGP